jgi:hypothetical protein
VLHIWVRNLLLIVASVAAGAAAPKNEKVTGRAL